MVPNVNFVVEKWAYLFMIYLLTNDNWCVQCPETGIKFEKFSGLYIKFVRKVWVIKNPDLAPA